MKPSFLLPVLLFFSASLWSQVEFAPKGAEWHFRYINFWGGIDAFATARNEGDTLLDGRVCKRIRLMRYTRDEKIPTSTETQFFYHSADSIFEYLPAPARQSNLIFRNNFSVGELFDNQFSRPLRVVDIDTLFFGDRMVRRFELHDTVSAVTDPWRVFMYDLFGPYRSIFDPHFGGIADSHEYYLRCYEDSTFPRASISAGDCTTILSPESQIYRVSLFPNPASDFLLLHFEGYFPAAVMEVTIWDVLGRPVFRENCPSADKRIELGYLPAGLYIVLIRMGDAVVQERFVKN